MGLANWTTDQAGPFQTRPYPGSSWEPEAHPQRQAHEYVRNGTAKMLTLFTPCSGHVSVKGVRHCTNDVLHPWLKQVLTERLNALPEPTTRLDLIGRQI